LEEAFLMDLILPATFTIYSKV